MDPHDLRAIILQLHDSLSDNDRKRLHFFLAPDVPRRIRDDQSHSGTLSLMESLLDQDKINERDLTFLINAFNEIQCCAAVKILREHMKRMQTNEQNESIQNLSSMLLEDQDEDKFAMENTLINQQNSYGDKNIIIDSNQTNINPVTVVVNKEPLKLNQKRRLKSLIMTIRVLLLLALVLIIVLLVAMGVCLKKINKLEKELETKNTAILTEQTKNNKSMEEIQWLTNSLNICKQELIMVRPGSTYGDVDGGVPFDDAVDLNLSPMTPCLGVEGIWRTHLFAIRFLYESNDTSHRKVYHGNSGNLNNANSALSSEKFLMSNKERINKVTLYAGTGEGTESHVFLRPDKTILRYIMGIQFYTTTGRKSLLYGVKNGEEFTESYAGYTLGYVKGRSGLLVDMLQFVWYGPGHPSTIYDGVWVEAQNGSIPLHALAGGIEDKREVHIVRFKTKEGDMLPGKLVEGSKVAEGAYQGVRTSSTYQVLTKSNPEQKWQWINTVGQDMPKDAFLAGKEADTNLYVGRVVLHSGSILVGKYQQTNGRVYVAHEGQQKEFLKDFQVLCAS